MSTSASTAYATDVALAIHDAAGPHLTDPAWCVNAAALASHVLRALGEKSWAMQCTILHANEPYAKIIGTAAEVELPHWSTAQPGDPYCVWSEAMSLARARGDEAQMETARRRGRLGLPGHVLTYVPGWRCWLDPSAAQFTKAEHSIVLEPCVWPDVGDPPGLGHWRRPDGGLTSIMPTAERGFTQASAWLRRGDDETRRIAKRALELLAQDPPDGGRRADRIPGILSP